MSTRLLAKLGRKDDPRCSARKLSKASIFKVDSPQNDDRCCES
jgi:hypothetical protein